MHPLIALIAGAFSSNGQPDPEPEALTYRTKDGHAYFQIQIERVREGFRVYLVEQPGGRTDGCHLLTHNGRPYICWDRPLLTVAAAKAVTAAWAEKEWQFLQTGKEF